ncbi:hypothetical protein D3C79_777080 [compost metagenome]
MIDPCLGLGLAQAGTLGHQLRQVSAVTFGQRPLRDGLGNNARRNTIGCVVTDRCRAIIAEQAVNEIGIGIRLWRHAGGSPYRACPGLCTGSGKATGGAQDQHGRHQRGHCPGKEAMGRITKIHFITLQIGPLHPQPTGDIAAQA